jgi:hypothetical protein
VNRNRRVIQSPRDECDHGRKLGAGRVSQVGVISKPVRRRSRQPAPAEVVLDRGSAYRSRRLPDTHCNCGSCGVVSIGATLDPRPRRPGVRVPIVSRQLADRIAYRATAKPCVEVEDVPAPAMGPAGPPFAVMSNGEVVTFAAMDRAGDATSKRRHVAPVRRKNFRAGDSRAKGIQVHSTWAHFATPMQSLVVRRTRSATYSLRSRWAYRIAPRPEPTRTKRGPPPRTRQP